MSVSNFTYRLRFVKWLNVIEHFSRGIASVLCSSMDFVLQFLGRRCRLFWAVSLFQGLAWHDSYHAFESSRKCLERFYLCWGFCHSITILSAVIFLKIEVCGRDLS